MSDAPTSLLDAVESYFVENSLDPAGLPDHLQALQLKAVRALYLKAVEEIALKVLLSLDTAGEHKPTINYSFIVANDFAKVALRRRGISEKDIQRLTSEHL